MGLGFLIASLWKLVVLCFLYTVFCTFLDTLKWFFTCLTVEKYNYYTSQFERKIEQKVVIPYQRNPTPVGEVIDISSLTKVAPKLVAKINIMTGKVLTEENWKKRGICECFLHPWNRGMAKVTTAKAETEIVEKTFLYTRALVNTLNLLYPNWQELNPELLSALQKDSIVAEEVIISHLCNFQH